MTVPPTLENRHSGLEAVRDPRPASYCRDGEFGDSSGVRYRGAAPEPLAIVGMAVRLPGGVDSPEDFWDLILNKKDGLCEVPGGRYNIDAFHNPDKLGSVRTRHGYYLDHDPSQFDHSFFSISRLEASKLDPQQRQLLEVIWECMENGGQVGWRGKRIGCYVGVFGEDWLDISSKDPQALDRYHVLSTGDFALSNRVSYEFDLRGPSMTLKTGCSSSLVGLHEACQAILNGDCSSAIVAGSNLILSPTMTTTMSANMVLSPNGICKTFDAGADGYGRGEAINALYIKPLEDAIHDGDCIRAVIRATATNCDGRTPSITTPGSQTQMELIKTAYARAGIHDMGDTPYFECHGTGTIVGDTAETSVVGQLFGTRETFIGAVKPNVGHSEGASGITSVIKAVLALENRTIPPNIHFSEPNPQILLDQYKLNIPTEPVSWPASRPERVSVNCFGIGGSNAHVIIDSARMSSSHGKQITPGGLKLVVTSAKHQDSLEKQINSLTDFVNNSEVDPDSLAYTLGERREHLSNRAFAILDSSQPLAPESFSRRLTASVSTPEVAFAFTGQGAQWDGVGRELSLKLGVFGEAIKTLDLALSSLDDGPQWSIQDQLMDGSWVHDAELSQTLCTAIQIGIVQVLKSWGVHPTCVVGHSSGEIAAAYAAGAISADTAIKLAYYRGKCVRTQAENGGMAAVGLSEGEVRSFLREGVVVACTNSPKSVTLSGQVETLDLVLRDIQERLPDVFSRKLGVNVAYHSDHMQKVADVYKECLAPHVVPVPSMIPMYSSVRSGAVTDPAELNAEYWADNLRHPVQFSRALGDLAKALQGGAVILEVGPHSALSGPIRETCPPGVAGSNDLDYVPTLVRRAEPLRCLLNTAGQLHIRSVPVNLAAINGRGSVLPNLPPYKWQYSGSLWSETRLTSSWRFREHRHHEILGSRCLESSTLEPAWRNLLHPEHVSWIWQHKIDNKMIFPCAGFVAMVGEAIQQITSVEPYSIENLILKAPLILEDMTATEILTTLRPERLNNSTNSSWYEFTISSCSGSHWVKHCTGKARPEPQKAHADPGLMELPRPVPSDFWYRTIKNRGIQYGPCFQGLQSISACPATTRAAATISDDRGLHESRYAVHPAAIDQALQLLSVACCHGLAYRAIQRGVPASIGQLYIRGGEAQMAAHASCSLSGVMYRGSVEASTPNGIAIDIQDALFFTLEGEGDLQNIPLVSQLEWKPAIDMVPPGTLLSSPPAGGETSVALAEKLALLYTLETAEKIKTIEPAVPHLHKYKTWILDRVEGIREGKDCPFPEAKTWPNLSSSDRRALMEDLRREIYSQAHDSIPVAVLADRVSANCVDLMRGDKSPLDVLMAEDYLEKMYTLQAKWSDWSSFLELLGHSKPTISILEIGAGTGSTTAMVLDLLRSKYGNRRYSRYDFTDISSGFLLRAKEKFKDVEGIEYRTLDISKSPGEQGFEANSYDLVVASNVLHATSNVVDTLENINALLAPGGYLLLQELCPTFKYINYIMGVLPGWWLGEHDGRVAEPYINPSSWNTQLQRANFTGVEAINYDWAPPYNLSATMISCRKPTPPPLCPVYILYNNRDAPEQPSHPVVDMLRKKGHEVHWTDIKDAPPQGGLILSLLDQDEPYLATMTPDEYQLLQKFLSNAQTCRIAWVTYPCQIECQDPRFGLSLGFARTMRHELGIDYSTVEMDNWTLDSFQHTLPSIIGSGQTTSLSRDTNRTLEYEFVVRDRTVYVGRFDWMSLTEVTLNNSTPESAKVLDIRNYGVLDTIEWTPAETQHPQNGQVEVDIHYVGLNFRDIMVSLGVMGSKDEFGFEATGVISRVEEGVLNLQVGDRVIVLDLGSLCERKITSARCCIPIPSGLSLQDAATMPCVFLTAIYALLCVGRIEAGQSVLIHSACGGVGQAAIQLCKMKNAQIFATVGNEEKAKYLTEVFSIPPQCIFHSRDSSFLQGVMKETENRGVDVVLNSLAGELLHTSWSCVAEFGTMIELGKRDFLERGVLDMAKFAGNRAFVGVDLLQVAQKCPSRIEKLFRDFNVVYEAGHIQPIRPVTAFGAGDVRKAFRHMQTGTHRGKILIDMHCNEPAPEISSRPLLELSPCSSYLLIGGLGGVGRVVSNWLVDRGARHLVFLSRSAGKTPSDQAFCKELQARGCAVTFVPGDAADATDAKRAVKEAVAGGPLAGVIQMSMVLNDQHFPRMSYDEWKRALVPKVDGTWAIHQALDQTPVDFFVVFSSIVGLGGNAGQANYAAANTFLDAFVAYRQSKGLAASALNLGVMDGVGIMARDTKLLDWSRAGSVRLVSEREMLDALDVAIRQSHRMEVEHQPRSSLLSAVLPIGFGNTKPLSEVGVRPLWNKDARFQLYDTVEASLNQAPRSNIDALREFLTRVEADPDVLEQQSSETIIKNELSRLIGSHVPQAESYTPEEWHNVAIDSLMTIEIRNWFRRNLGLEVSAVDISNAGTVGGLSKVTIKALRDKYKPERAEE